MSSIILIYFDASRDLYYKFNFLVL